MAKVTETTSGKKIKISKQEWMAIGKSLWGINITPENCSVLNPREFKPIIPIEDAFDRIEIE